MEILHEINNRLKGVCFVSRGKNSKGASSLYYKVIARYRTKLVNIHGVVATGTGYK